ncbi:MAG: cytochrome c oxidase accessory protein CcoG [Bdellovibrionaceae bacterium]|nr:cytochrome c oxidase accessory protein CcoG [Pseudobdellovibrionaceae bacterium]
MSYNPRDLPTERPSTLDKKGFRVYIHPAEVLGYFRTRRNLVYGFLVFIFLVLPWTQFQGKQTILLDLAQREFTFFGSTFYAHDAPLFFFPVFIFAMLLVFITSVFGRAWCGWACPQTVFIDFIYRKIEKWIEGNHVERKKLDEAPMSVSKFSKRALKWILFFLVSAHIAHSFTAYFVGAKPLLLITLGNPLNNINLFIFVHSLTLLFLFDFGWFREQFCIIMCPYGRFQSVLMDKDSLTVAYNEKRGEPRGKKGPGDCVDCYKCVIVCPTGIDIRNGSQLECIACTACIDACDDVMTRLKLPTGLIGYSSEAELEGKKRKLINWRSGSYLAIILGLSIAFSIILFFRQPVEFKVLRASKAPFSITEEQGQRLVLNHFKLHLTNQTQTLIQIDIVNQHQDSQLLSPEFPLSLSPSKDRWSHIFFKTPIDKFKNKDKIQTQIQLKYKDRTETLKINLLGPQQH